MSDRQCPNCGGFKVTYHADDGCQRNAVGGCGLLGIIGGFTLVVAGTRGLLGAQLSRLVRCAASEGN